MCKTYRSKFICAKDEIKVSESSCCSDVLSLFSEGFEDLLEQNTDEKVDEIVVKDLINRYAFKT